MSARDYYAAKDRLWPRVAAAYDRLAGRFDRIVLEGAGSPVEINLAEHDLTNLRMARHADAAVVLVADIERGGVFAQLVGTWELLEPEDRARVVGFLINKFRGDADAARPGPRPPPRPDRGAGARRPALSARPADRPGRLARPGRDGDRHRRSEPGPDDLDVGGRAAARPEQRDRLLAVVAHPRRPGPLRRRAATDLGRPDLVILPGTKTTVRDLDWLRRVGLADRIVALARDDRGPLVLGICGGFQMLGQRIDDPLGVESERETRRRAWACSTSRPGSQPEKARHRVLGTVHRVGSLPITGYEIHMGETRPGRPSRPGSR